MRARKNGRCTGAKLEKDGSGTTAPTMSSARGRSEEPLDDPVLFRGVWSAEARSAFSARGGGGSWTRVLKCNSAPLMFESTHETDMIVGPGWERQWTAGKGRSPTVDDQAAERLAVERHLVSWHLA